MRDFKAVQLDGAVRSPRARVLFHLGQMKVFTEAGEIASAQASEPVKRKGWRLVWDVDTELGRIEMRQRCMTCGGWWKTLATSAEALWHGEERQTTQV